jgi:hypothetical protein
MGWPQFPQYTGSFLLIQPFEAGQASIGPNRDALNAVLLLAHP